jgi:hypothetical protein
MKAKRLVTLMIVTLSVALLTQRIPATLSVPSSVDTFADVRLAVDPEGEIAVTAFVNDTERISAEQLLNSTALGTLEVSEDTVHLNLTLLVPEANATSFPFNTTTVTVSAVYVEDGLDVDVNLTATAPSKSVYCPYLSDEYGSETCELLESMLNSTDFVLDAAFLEGDATFMLAYEMTANMSDLLSSMVNLTVGFQAPFTVNLNVSNGAYEGTVNLILIPGLPVEDVAVDVEGNLTSVYFNGSVQVIYGIYPDFEMTLNQTYIDDLEYRAENVFNASIDVEGSLLNITEGMLECTTVNVDRQSLDSEGEDVTFDVRISEAVPGGFVYYPTLALDFPPMDPLTQWYPLLIPFTINDTLHSIQDGQIQLIYTPATTRLYLTMEGTLHVLDLVDQLLQPKDVPEEWPELALGAPPQLNATTLPYEWLILSALNVTVHSIDGASFHNAYYYDTRKAKMNFTASVSFDEFYQQLVTILAETSLEVPAELIPLLERLIAGVTTFQASMTYADGAARLLMDAEIDGDVNTEANLMINDLFTIMNATGADLAPWQLTFLNDTLFDLSTLTLDVAVDPVSTTLMVDGLTVRPPIDAVNASAFTFDRFFNLSAEMIVPDALQQLQVAVTGTSNATHRVILSTTTGVPVPDEVTRDADQQIIQMVWHNVSFNDLRALHFLIVSGADHAQSHVIPYGGEDYVVTTLSNSTITDVAFDQPNKLLSFYVTGASGIGGYCNVTIPNQLLGGTFVVLVNDVAVFPTITQNSTHGFIYFEYTHSTQLIEIIGTTVISEFPAMLAVGLLLSLIAVLTLVTRKRRS